MSRRLFSLAGLALALISADLIAQDASARAVQYHSQDIVPIHAKLKYTTLIDAKMLEFQYDPAQQNTTEEVIVQELHQMLNQQMADLDIHLGHFLDEPNRQLMVNVTLRIDAARRAQQVVKLRDMYQKMHRLLAICNATHSASVPPVVVPVA